VEELHIIKLGGSIITEKKASRPVLRVRRIKEIAREIKRARSKDKNTPLIILYGGGSFGHPLAHRYQLLDRSLSRDAFMGVGYTVSAVRELGTRLATLLLDAGVPVMPLQTSSFAQVKKGQLRFTDLSIVELILKNGGVPLFGGDVVVSDTGRTAIASADALAVALTGKRKKSRLLFATDTDGVYASFPPHKHQQPLAELDRVALKKFLKTQSSQVTRRDVTGAMLGKLRALLAARDTTALIFNGNTRGIFAEVLSGKQRGSRIIL
jgi:isopentenyl phosphate kinase